MSIKGSIVDGIRLPPDPKMKLIHKDETPLSLVEYIFKVVSPSNNSASWVLSHIQVKFGCTALSAERYIKDFPTMSNSWNQSYGHRYNVVFDFLHKNDKVRG